MIVRARPTRFGMVLPYGVRYGMGYVSPVGFSDENSFQSAVIASYPACPPPFDPTCENPRDAAISANLAEWVSNPQSCHNVVCNSSGAPAPVVSPTGQVGYNTTSGFVATTPVVAPARAAPPVGVIHGGPVPRPRPTPIQSSSPAGAPGGSAASPAAPTPVQTQTAPSDGSTPATAIVLASDCTATQTYIPPGGAYSAGPSAGQVAPYGACQDNPAAAGTSNFGTMLSNIPVWGWGLAALGAILIFRPGGKR